MAVAAELERRTNGNVRGLTADELAFRIGVDIGILQPILNDERHRGRVLLDPVAGRYRLAVDAFDPETFEALVELVLI